MENTDDLLSPEDVFFIKLFLIGLRENRFNEEECIPRLIVSLI